MDGVKNRMSIYEAFKTYGIPESVMCNSIKSQVTMMLVPKNIEDDIASHITFLIEIQQPLIKAEISSVLQDYFTINELKNPFSKENNGPGTDNGFPQEIS